MTSIGTAFSTIGRNLRGLGSAPVSWAWATVIMAIHFWVVAAGGPTRPLVWSWFEMFGLSRDGFLAGRIWQIFSYGLLHGNGWHAGLNALFCLCIGSRIEHIAGRALMLKATIAGVIGGGVGHLLLAAGGEGAPVLVGLSGGCLSLLVLFTTLSPESRLWPLPVSGRSLGIGVLLAELVLALIDPSLGLPGFARIGEWLAIQGIHGGLQTGHACHFGGGLAGWLLGRWLLRPRTTLARLRRERARLEADRNGETE